MRPNNKLVIFYKCKSCGVNLEYCSGLFPDDDDDECIFCKHNFDINECVKYDFIDEDTGLDLFRDLLRELTI